MSNRLSWFEIFLQLYLFLIAGDSSQDEAEDDTKQITVRVSSWTMKYCSVVLYCSDFPGYGVYYTYLRNGHLSLIKVRFSRPESEQARQRRIQSYEFLQKKQAEEPWVHLHYHGLKVGVTR